MTARLDAFDAKFNSYLSKSGVTTNLNINTGSSVKASSIFGAILGTGLSVATEYTKGATKAAEAQNTKAAKTKSALGAISTASAKVQIIEKQITAKQKELDTIDAKIKKSENADSEITKLKDQKTKLQNKYKTGDKDPQVLTDYNNAKSNVTKLETAQKEITNVDTQILSSKSQETKFRDASSGSSKHSLKSIQLGKGNAIATIQQYANDISMYATQTTKTGADGKETKEPVFDQAGYNADLAEATKLDQNWNNAEIEKNKQTQLTEKKTTLAKNAGVNTPEEISTKLTEAKAKVTAFESKEISNDSSDTTTVGQYNSQIEDIDKQIKEYETLKTSKDTLTAERKTVNESITSLKKQLETAQQEEITTKAKFAAFYDETSGLVDEKSDVDAAKAQYKDSKAIGKNGKTRTFWQKLIGSNKSDKQKNARADYRKARSEYNQALQDYRTTYGIDPTSKFKAQLEKKYGLGETS